MSNNRQQNEAIDRATWYASSRLSESDIIPFADADVFYSTGEDSRSTLDTHPHLDSIDSEDSVSLNNLLDALDGTERSEESEEDCLNSSSSEPKVNSCSSFDSKSEKQLVVKYVDKKCNFQKQDQVLFSKNCAADRILTQTTNKVIT